MAYLDKIAQNNPHKPIISRYNMQSERNIHFCIQKKLLQSLQEKWSSIRILSYRGLQTCTQFLFTFPLFSFFLNSIRKLGIVKLSILLTYLEYLEFMNDKSYKNHITIKKISYIMKTNHFEIMYFFVDKEKIENDKKKKKVASDLY